VGGLFRCGCVVSCAAYLAVKLALATNDKKSVDCESRRDCFAGDSCVPRDGGGHGRCLLGFRPGGAACIACG
jgi:hypothetical protein